jgi:hypothetical protein
MENNINDNDGINCPNFIIFVKWLEGFCEATNIVEYTDSDQYAIILGLEEEDIIGLTAGECFAKAITLMNYTGMLQKKLDMLNSQHAWCVEVLNFIFAKQWESYDKYLPAEIKKQSIIRDNSYATMIEKYRLRMHGGILLLTETIKDLKKRVSIFQDLGKARSFK